MDLYSVTLDKARKMALKAKPGYMIFNGKTYTFVFNQTEWNYVVYENMIFLMNINTKSLVDAKKFTKFWLTN